MHEFRVSFGVQYGGEGSVQQPWAWAIIYGGKDVENRTQLWRHRGPLAIHAGRRLSERGFDFPPMVEAFIAAGLGRDEDADPFPLGAIIGTVDVVDAHWCHPSGPSHAITPCCQPWGEAAYDEHPTGRTRSLIAHLVVRDPVPLADPIPWSGRLGVWDLPDEVLTA